MEVGIVAQHIMDLYYQQFKSDEDFFDQVHFDYLTQVGYAKLLQDEYERNYKLNLQVEGIGYVTINQDWIKTEILKIERDEHDQYFIKPSIIPFSFSFDQQNSGIQSLEPFGKSAKACGNFVRMNAHEKWKLCHLPVSSFVWWTWENEKIIFEKLECKPEKIKLRYVPRQCLDIADSRAPMVIEWVLALMQKARQGTVIDMTNDSNNNKAMLTEINNIFNGKMKTKS